MTKQEQYNEMWDKYQSEEISEEAWMKSLMKSCRTTTPGVSS